MNVAAGGPPSRRIARRVWSARGRTAAAAVRAIGRSGLVGVVLLTALVAAGCARAGERVSTAAGAASGPERSTTIPAPSTTSVRNAVSTIVASSVPTPTTAPTVTVTVSTVARPPGPVVPTVTVGPGGAGPRVLAVACARHPEDGGDWVVFTLSSPATTAVAAFGTAGIPIAGDATLLLTLTPAVNGTDERFTVGSSCDHVAEVVAVARPDGSLVWVIGTRGLPRLLNTPVPASTAAGTALVVKLGS